MVQFTLETIKESLSYERTTREAEIAEILADLETKKAELQGVISALAALTGEPLAIRNGNGHKRVRPSKPSANKEDISKLIASVVRDEEALGDEGLKERVEEKLVAAGFNRLGFALRFKEALAEAKIHMRCRTTQSTTRGTEQGKPSQQKREMEPLTPDALAVHTQGSASLR